VPESPAADRTNRFGDLLSSLGAACRRDDDFLGNAIQLERDVENQSASQFQLNRLSGRSGESFGLSFDDVFTLCDSRKPILPLGIRRGIQLDAVLTNIEPDLGIRDAASLRVQNGSCQTLGTHNADEAQHGPYDDDELMHGCLLEGFQVASGGYSSGEENPADVSTF